MLKPTKTIFALAAGSLVLGLVGASSAVAEDDGFKAAAHPLGKVVSKGPLKVRSKPTTHARTVGQVYPHSKVELWCKEHGEYVDGNNIWYRLVDRHGNSDNGNWQNGDSENGSSEHGDWQNGAGRPNGRGSDGDKAYGEERWVSARYVRNLDRVKPCY
ncbi:hypothetical protein [Streptomyces sp. NPDC059874]|uniref:hypothetical protein n=1 Tax=Streptomyces sp. NPDC059874 TaxID=3346983 RepID=UPI00366041B3